MRFSLTGRDWTALEEFDKPAVAKRKPPLISHRRHTRPTEYPPEPNRHPLPYLILIESIQALQ